MKVDSFRGVKVWQTGMELARRVYALSGQFPKHEVYGLSSQLRRAAVSIPANIAEGHARSSTKDYLRHLSIVRGSLAELETLLTLADDLGYCASNSVGELLALCDKESRMLSGLRRRLREKIDPPP